MCGQGTERVESLLGISSAQPRLRTSEVCESTKGNQWRWLILHSATYRIRENYFTSKVEGLGAHIREPSLRN